MATSQQFLVCDSSTLANFKSWAQAISAFFATAGWTQSTDTGQVNWTSIAAVPGTNVYVYEIWQPNDGLTNFYLKVEYGNLSVANSPSIRLSIAQTTNGSGTLTGATVGPWAAAQSSFTPPSTTTTYECDLSGAAGRFGALMWRNAASNAPQLFAIERSVNSSGAYTGTYVTLFVAGNPNSSIGTAQGTLLFGVGVAPTVNQGTAGAGWIVRANQTAGGSINNVFNGAIPFDTCTPLLGYFDYPSTVVGAGFGANYAEGVTFNVTLYGATRTYMPTKLIPNMGNWFGGTLAICLRYD